MAPFTGDSLLVGDVGRPDLHAGGDARPLARAQYQTMRRLLALPDHVLVYPSHYGSSVCGPSLSGNPFSSIGFERRHNRALQHASADEFVRALLVDLKQRGLPETRNGRSRDALLVSCAQAGFASNLNDALAWGLAPLYLAAHGAGAHEIAAVAALYPAI